MSDSEGKFTREMKGKEDEDEDGAWMNMHYFLCIRRSMYHISIPREVGRDKS